MYQSIKQKLGVAEPPKDGGKVNFQVVVKALEAKDLIPADSNGLSDPYVKLSMRSELAPRKVKYFKSKVIKKTLNPKWNESFVLSLEDPKSDFLHIEVWDKDFIPPDDPLGYIYFKLDNLSQGVEVQKWLRLASVPHGEILISVKALNFTSYNPDTIDPDRAFDNANQQFPSPIQSAVYAPSYVYAPGTPNNNVLDPCSYTQSYLPNAPAYQIPPQSYPQQPLNTPPLMFVQPGDYAPNSAPHSAPNSAPHSAPNSAPHSAPHSPLPNSNVSMINPPPAANSQDLIHAAHTQGFDLDFSQIRFVSRIGAGAFGEVWKGEWAGTTVAVKKILKTDISEDDLKEFSDEIMLMSKLRHPNIVQFLGACLHPEFCLVTEFMDRGSLFHVLGNESLELKWDVRVQFASDIARGMLYLHTRNPPIVHRDIKSLNILVTKDWKSTISDFGLTRIKDKAITDSKVGSPAWSAPEVLRSEEYNEKADVYSYAIVLWEIITRKTPYENLANPMQLIGQVAYQKPSLRPPIPECPLPAFTELMVSCWDDVADNRPDFHKILETLKSISKSL